MATRQNKGRTAVKQKKKLPLARHKKEPVTSLRKKAIKGVESGIFSSVDEGVRQLLKKEIYGVHSAPVKDKPTGPRKRSPMEKERVLSTMKSKAQKMGANVRSGEEMKAATEGLDTLTDKGPGKLKLALRGGGRAFGKNS